MTIRETTRKTTGGRLFFFPGRMSGKIPGWSVVPGLVTLLLSVILGLSACNPFSGKARAGNKGADNMNGTKAYPISELPQNQAGAILAGGCFWCMEQPLEQVEGVVEVISGYCGGSEKAPAYKEVSSGQTSHVESVLVIYEPAKISYEQILYHYWRNINPVQKNGQFYDRGPHYRTVIYYLNEEQKRIARESRAELESSGKFKEPIATEISPATEFWVAEEYHQDYYKKNPAHYNQYKKGSGRADYIKETWGK